MRRYERWLAALCLVAGACRAEVDAIPPIPADTRAVLWAEETGAGEWRLEAFELAEQPWRFSRTLADDTQVVVFAYPDSLFGLGLVAGPIRPASGADSRRLPPSETLLQSRVGGAIEWRRLETLPPGLDSYRIEALDAVACVNASGCLSESTEGARCVRPCPVISVVAPSPATAASFTPCPDGWRPEDRPTDGSTVCEPGRSMPTSCPGGQYQPAGAQACLDLGTACQNGFPSAPPTDSVLYVDAAAGPGGDGSQAAPFDTLTAAVDASAGTTSVLIAAGTYAENVTLRPGLTLRGVCAAVVRVGAPATVAVASGAAGLVGVTIDGAVRVESGRLNLAGADVIAAEPLVVEDTAALSLEGVRVTVAATSALIAGGDSQLDLRSVEIVGGGLSMRERSSATVAELRVRGADGGILVQDAATMDGGEVVVEAGETGLTVDGADVEVTLSDVVVRDVEGPSAVRNLDGRATLTRLQVHDAGVYGVLVADGELRIADGLIRDLRTTSSGSGGWGIRVNGGLFAANRLAIRRVWHLGLMADSRTAVVRLEDSVIEDVTAAPGDPFRFGGIRGFNGTSIALDRVEIRRVEWTGIGTRASIDGVTVTARDLVIEDVAPRFDGQKGHGIVADDAAQLQVARARINRTQGFGVDVRGSGTYANLTDIEVTQTATNACDPAECFLGRGVGITVSDTARMDIRRFWVHDNVETGIRLDATLGVTAADGWVQGNPLGLWVSDPTLSLFRLVERVRFENNATALRTTP